MGRGKIEIKRIDNQTNRQVTYSKRRNGIFKKAEELTVLCDAKVSIIMLSGSTNKLHNYVSKTTSTKEMFDMYQNTLKTDLWKSHYERMQKTLKELEEKNYEYRRAIRQRLGHDLNGLSFAELHALEDKISSSLDIIRKRTTDKINTQTNTLSKKVKSLKENSKILVSYVRLNVEKQPKCEVDTAYGLVEDHYNEREYESEVALANGASNLYAFRNHHHHPANLYHNGGEGFAPCYMRDLSLA
uniref:MADS55 n=1 Tax=Hippophae rhamnoides TaxID=193516 RepID=A0AAU7LJJ2_9ROSA